MQSQATSPPRSRHSVVFRESLSLYQALAVREEELREVFAELSAHWGRCAWAQGFLRVESGYLGMAGGERCNMLLRRSVG